MKVVKNTSQTGRAGPGQRDFSEGRAGPGHVQLSAGRAGPGQADIFEIRAGPGHFPAEAGPWPGPARVLP